MAETTYYPSTSGYSSDLYGTVGEYYFSSKNGWSTSTSTVIQGGTDLGDGTARFNYYGIMYFDFATIRAKCATHNPVRIRLRLKSHYGSTRTVYVHMGKGMAKDTYSSSARPTDATGTAVKTVSIAANSWGEINTTDSAWLNALDDTTTTCFYVNRYPSGYGDGFMSPWDTGSYWEGDGSKHTNKPELIIDWVLKNTAPTAPSSITISTTDRIVNGSGNVGATTSHDVSCTAGSDAETAASSLQYQFEYSVAGGTWTVFRSWATNDTTATLSLTSIPAGSNIQFRVQVKDGGGLTSGYRTSTNYGYKIMTPSAPPSVTTPANFVSTNKATAFPSPLAWGACSSYDAIVGIRYEVQIYDPKTASWIIVASAWDGTSLPDIAPYSALGLSGSATLQYYYYTTNKIRVRTKTYTAVQGTYLYSAFTESAAFTIDFRSAPVVAFGTFTTTNLYEGAEYTIPITKTAAGNDVDSAGNAMQYNYKVELLYNGSSSIMLQTSNAVWASLGTSVTVTIPSIANTSDVGSCSVKLTITTASAMSSNVSLTGRTVKRYRDPVATITNITRSETEFVVTFTITDTGLTAQTVGEISTVAGTTRLTFPSESDVVPTISGLSNQQGTFSVTTSQMGLCTLYVYNNPGDGMTKKSTIVSQNVPTFLPNFRIQSDGVYAKDALYVWDANGAAAKVLTEKGGAITGDLIVSKDNARIDFNRAVGGSGQYAAMRFFDGGVIKGGLYWDYTNDKLKIVPDGTNFYDIWHSGNFNPTDYLPLTGGTLTGVLRLPDPADASLSSTTHAFQIGASNSYNIAMDGNEIMARNNGAVSALYLNSDGGSVYINGQPAFNSGSNSNGDYIKFPDGTLICWLRTTVTNQAINNVYGSLYQGTREWTYPVAFVGDAPAVSCSHFAWGTSASWGAIHGSPGLTSATLRGLDYTSRATGTSVYISAMAIGRWK